jgi:hypothetical protein
MLMVGKAHDSVCHVEKALPPLLPTLRQQPPQLVTSVNGYEHE